MTAQVSDPVSAIAVAPLAQRPETDITVSRRVADMTKAVRVLVDQVKADSPV
jgi:hypothetical protein